MKTNRKTRPGLVGTATDRLRDLILETPPGEHLGSLNEVASRLGVGIVTVQQAARVLEHEGLLAVKRGPGGGYYGARPDDAAIERAFATYMRVHDISYREAFELAVLLDCDIIVTAARSLEREQFAEIQRLIDLLESSTAFEDCMRFEIDFRETLLGIFDKPLLALLAHVAVQLYNSEPEPGLFDTPEALDEWKQGRRRILDAILAQDEELAGFEAERYRRMVMRWMGSDR